MILAIIVDILAWIVLVFWLASWTQNFLALILVHFYFILPNEKSNSDTKLPTTSLPGVTIIKPLTGSDDHLYHNLESWFKIEYPLFEILFAVHGPIDPAVPIVFELMKRYPHVDSKLIISETVSPIVILANGSTYTVSAKTCNCNTPLKSEKVADEKNPVPCFCSSSDNIVNPKIRNMLPAYDLAKFGLVFLSDCYVEAEPDTIRDVVDQMGPKVGTVCQMYYCRDPPTVTFGSIVNKVLFGTHNAKSILCLYFLRVVACCGAAMLIRKEALEECGGLRGVGCYLAEDFHIGLGVAKKGWANRLGRKLAWQNPAQVEISDVFQRLIRWKRLRQATMPFLMVAEPLFDCMVLAIVVPLALAYLSGVGASFPFWSFATMHVIAWFFVDYFLLSTVNNGPLNFSKPIFLLAWLTRELAVPFLHLVAVSSRYVSWRNQQFYVRLGGLTERIPSPQQTPSIATITPSNHQLYAVKSFTSTPSGDAIANNSSDSSGCVIDFIQESPIITEETPSNHNKDWHNQSKQQFQS